jgi:hypothetical protein
MSANVELLPDTVVPLVVVEVLLKPAIVKPAPLVRTSAPDKAKVRVAFLMRVIVFTAFSYFY